MSTEITDFAFPPCLIGSRELAGMKNEATLIYLTLRASTIHGHPVKLDELPDLLGMLPLTVKRNIETLIRKRWMSSHHHDGWVLADSEGWFLERLIASDPETRPRNMAHAEEVSAKFETLQSRLASEHRAASTHKLRKTLGVKKPRKINSSHVMQKFLDRYEVEYAEKLPYARQKALAMCRRTLDWANGDLEHVSTVIDFLFENWSRIKKVMKLRGVRPGLEIIGTASLWSKIRDLSVTGFKADFRIKDRGDSGKTETPKIGWE